MGGKNRNRIRLGMEWDWSGLVVAFACSVLLAGCDSFGENAKREKDAAQLEEAYRTLQKYAMASPGTNGEIVRLRGEAIQATEKILSQCLVSKEGCRDINVALTSKILQEIAEVEGDYALTDIEVIDERKDLKSFHGIMDYPSRSHDIAVIVELRGPQSLKIQVGQLVRD